MGGKDSLSRVVGGALQLCEGGTKQTSHGEREREGREEGGREKGNRAGSRGKEKEKERNRVFWAVLNLKTKTTSFGFKANFPHLIHFVNSIIK